MLYLIAVIIGLIIELVVIGRLRQAQTLSGPVNGLVQLAI